MGGVRTRRLLPYKGEKRTNEGEKERKRKETLENVRTGKKHVKTRGKPRHENTTHQMKAEDHAFFICSNARRGAEISTNRAWSPALLTSYSFCLRTSTRKIEEEAAPHPRCISP